MANNTITAPKGFAATGIHCGIKSTGKPDLALLHCPDGARAAAVFTTNKIVSAAVNICREHIKSTKTYSVIINSGNANTCTGAKGLAAAKVMCAKAAKELKVDSNQVLIASTGIIGRQLPIAKIVQGIARAAPLLSESAAAGMNFAKAILTTDTRTKNSVQTFEINGKEVTIAGTVKGAGMIGPQMATTICVLTTDAAISKPLLRKALKSAIGESLNRLTIDGHQSTNDTALLLASGQAGHPLIKKQNAAFGRFTRTLTELCSELARQMALDAERNTDVYRQNGGAATKADALQAARAIANYDLVKCAVHGGDPNWGRIICAAGSCGVKLDPSRLTCKIGEITVFRNGKPAEFDYKKASQVISGKEHIITVDLGVGNFEDFCYGCDLSEEYVKINAEYHT